MGGGGMGGRIRRQGGMGGGPDTSGDTVGAVVRLAFHDAAGFDQASFAADGFGMDACVDFDNGDNNGLQAIVAQLDALWATNFCTLISKADFYVLAAYVAVEVTAPASYTSPPFRYGRRTNDVCNDTAVSGRSRLPAANGGVEEIDRVFVDAMGLTRTDAVTLIGAHTLGRMEAGISGFDGPWTNNPDVFDNEYYDTLVNDPWNRATVAAGTEWRFQGTIMLNADMELAYDVVDDSDVLIPGINRCGPVRNPDDCQTSSAFNNLATTYANDENAWLTAFSASLQRMVEVGYAEGSLSTVSGTARQRRFLRGRVF